MKSCLSLVILQDKDKLQTHEGNKSKAETDNIQNYDSRKYYLSVIESLV